MHTGHCISNIHLLFILLHFPFSCSHALHTCTEREALIWWCSPSRPSSGEIRGRFWEWSTFDGGRVLRACHCDLHILHGDSKAFYRMETDYLQLKGWSLTWLFSWVLWQFWNNMEGGGLHTKKLMWSLYYKTFCMWITFNSLALSDNIFKGAANWGMVNAGWPGYVCMCVYVCLCVHVRDVIAIHNYNQLQLITFLKKL